MLRVERKRSILNVRDSVVTRILLEVLDERTNMSHDEYARHVRKSNKKNMSMLDMLENQTRRA